MANTMVHVPRKRYTSAASFVSKAHDHCTVPSCIRPPHHWGAAYCTKHAFRLQRHGHVACTSIKGHELAQFSEWVDYGLRAFDGTPAVTLALRKAHLLLTFKPTTAEPWQTYLAGRMASVREKAGRVIDARQLLLVILTLFAFEAAHPERLPNTTSRDIALARVVVRLGRCRQPEPRKADLMASGAFIAEQFGLFAALFLRELQKRTRAEAQRAERERAALVNFGSPAVS